MFAYKHIVARDTCKPGVNQHTHAPQSDFVPIYALFAKTEVVSDVENF